MHDFFEIEVYDYPGIRLTSVYITKTIVARNAKGRFMSVYASARAVTMSGNEEKRLNDLRDVAAHYAKMGRTHVVFCKGLSSKR